MGCTISCLEGGAAASFLQGALYGDVKMMEERLLQDPLLVIHKGGFGGLRDTAWHLAAAQGHVSILESLHRHLEQHSALVTKALNKRLQPSKQFTEEQGRMNAVNLLNVKGQSPLMFACFAGKAECAALLIKMGADPWISDYCGRRSALHYAAMHGHTACITAMLEATPPALLERVGRNNSISKVVDMPNVSGLTPLHYAAHSKVPGLLKALLDQGANMVAMSLADVGYDIVSCPKWTTALHLCAIGGFEVGAKEILKHYLAVRDSGRYRDPRVCSDRASRLPFHVATLKGHFQLAELLHPMTNLETVFPTDEVDKVGVPKLSLLAARVLQQHLLALVDTADAKIALLPTLDSVGGPLGSSSLRKALPSAKQQRQSNLGAQPRGSLTHATTNALGTVQEAASPFSSATLQAMSGELDAVEGEAPWSPGNSKPLERDPSAKVRGLPRLLQSLSRPWGTSDDGAAAGAGAGEGSGGSMTRGSRGADGTAGAARPPVGRRSRGGGGGGGASSVGGGSPDPEPSWWGAGAPLGPGGTSSPRGGSPPRPRGGSPSGRSRAGGSSPPRGSSAEMPIEADWWATSSPQVPIGQPPILGAPTPGDKTADTALGRTPSLMQRVKSLGMLSKRGSLAKEFAADGGGGGGGTSSLTSGEAGGPPVPTVASALDAATRARLMQQPANPFATISWGTSAMIAALPSYDQCTVCLDDVYALVLVPCLHRLCVPCSRRLVCSIKDKPLGCPVCRRDVKGAYAPHDAKALETALNMHEDAEAK